MNCSPALQLHHQVVEINTTRAIRIVCFIVLKALIMPNVISGRNFQNKCSVTRPSDLNNFQKEICFFGNMLLSQWGWVFSRGKCRPLSPGKVSCNRVALLNYKAHAGSLRVSVVHRIRTWTTGSLTCARDHSYACVDALLPAPLCSYYLSSMWLPQICGRYRVVWQCSAFAIYLCPIQYSDLYRQTGNLLSALYCTHKAMTSM